MSTAWRIRANSTVSGWCWDVRRLRFFTEEGGPALVPTAALCSGSASDNAAVGGYEADVAVLKDGNGFWGGRADREKQFWIGADFGTPVNVAAVTYEEVGDHKAVAKCRNEAAVFLECRSGDGTWVMVRELEREWPAPVPDVPEAMAWRLRAKGGTVSGWSWDVKGLRFFTLDAELPPCGALSSGSASDDGGPKGYSAAGAVLQDRVWGGRKGTNDFLWVGAQFVRPVQVTRVHFCEPSSDHAAIRPVLEWQTEDGQWLELRAIAEDEREEEHDPLSELPTPGKPPCNDELVCASSRPLTREVADVSLRASLHEPRNVFIPDSDFYLSENCEGVWVCASKAVGPEVLRRACILVRAVLPDWQRKLWGQFVSPRRCKDPGPMRIIILDDRTDEQAGCIPELDEGNTGGRNSTSCPFVFTSREDFDGGVGSWQLGALTAHEMCHGADMVLRQLYDPCFHEDVAKLYASNREFFRWQKAQGTGRTVTKNCYACANRDEFLAESHTLLLGMLSDRKDYCSACLSTPEQLEQRCPEVTSFLRKHFNYPKAMALV